MLKTIVYRLLLFSFIFYVSFFTQVYAGTKSSNKVACCLLDDDYNMSLLRSEFEAIKSAVIPRTEGVAQWNGIPLQNALGTTDAQGLQLCVSIKNDKMEPCYPTKYLDKVPYIKAILEQIEICFNTKVGLVRIFKLPPNNALGEHTDGKIFDIYSGKVFRLHIPIITNSDVQFIINKKAFYLEPGKLYFTNVSLPHYVVNKGTQDRIHLIIDVHASDELRNFILQSEELKNLPL